VSILEKKYYSFAFDKKILDEFNNSIPERQRSRVLRNYILEQYKLPEDLSVLEFVPEIEEIQPFYFNQKSSDIIDFYVSQARDAGFKKINRSSIMRDVMKNIIEEKKEGMQQRKLKSTSFLVDKGVIGKLDQFIPEQDRIPTIERFILEEYQPPQENVELLKIRPDENEKYRVSMDEKVLNLLDDYVTQIGVKGITRTAVFRDVTRKLLQKLSNEKTETSKEMYLERKFKKVFQEYVQAVGEETVKEKVEQYFKQD
jgi:metal-responsive CopG/Arc/MetJ family transcriptional regulator